MRWHMGGQTAVLAFAMTAWVLSDDLTRVIQGDRTLRQMGFQPLALQGIRDRVIVLLQVDVVILADQHRHHFGDGIWYLLVSLLREQCL